MGLIKLYDVPRDSRISVEHLKLEVKDTGELIKELDFKHIDGMYSLSYYHDKIIHLAAWTEVYLID